MIGFRRDGVDGEAVRGECHLAALRLQVFRDELRFRFRVRHVIDFHAFCGGDKRVALYPHLKRALGGLPGKAQGFHRTVGVDCDIIGDQRRLAVNHHVGRARFHDPVLRHSARQDDVVVFKEGSLSRVEDRGRRPADHRRVIQREIGEPVCFKGYGCSGRGRRNLLRDLPVVDHPEILHIPGRLIQQGDGNLYVVIGLVFLPGSVHNGYVDQFCIGQGRDVNAHRLRRALEVFREGRVGSRCLHRPDFSIRWEAGARIVFHGDLIGLPICCRNHLFELDLLYDEHGKAACGEFDRLSADGGVHPLRLIPEMYDADLRVLIQFFVQKFYGNGNVLRRLDMLARMTVADRDVKGMGKIEIPGRSSHRLQTLGNIFIILRRAGKQFGNHQLRVRGDPAAAVIGSRDSVLGAAGCFDDLLQRTGHDRIDGKRVRVKHDAVFRGLGLDHLGLPGIVQMNHNRVRVRDDLRGHRHAHRMLRLDLPSVIVPEGDIHRLDLFDFLFHRRLHGVQDLLVPNQCSSHDCTGRQGPRFCGNPDPYLRPRHSGELLGRHLLRQDAETVYSAVRYAVNVAADRTAAVSFDGGEGAAG